MFWVGSEVRLLRKGGKPCFHLPSPEGMAEFEEIEKSLEKNQGIVQITGCLESQKAHLIHGLSGKTPMRLVIAGDERQAKEIFEDLRFYDKNTMFYPAKDLLFFQADIQGNLLIRQRMCVIKALLEQKELTVVTSIDGCMDYLMPLEEIGKRCFISILTA